MDAFFDRQVIYDFKDGRNHADVAKCVAKMLVKKFGRKVRSVVSSCVPASSQERNEARNRRTRQTLWGGRTDANPKLSLNDI